MFKGFSLLLYKVLIKIIFVFQTSFLQDSENNAKFEKRSKTAKIIINAKGA